MNIPHTAHGQVGAVLSMEYSILLTVGAISALGLAILYSVLASGTWYTWLTEAIDTAENAFQDYNNSFCAAVNLGPTFTNGAGNVGPYPGGAAPLLPSFTGILPTNSCGGAVSTTSWVQGAGS